MLVVFRGSTVTVQGFFNQQANRAVRIEYCEKRSRETPKETLWSCFKEYNSRSQFDGIGIRGNNKTSSTHYAGGRATIQRDYNRAKKSHKGVQIHSKQQINKEHMHTRQLSALLNSSFLVSLPAHTEREAYRTVS